MKSVEEIVVDNSLVTNAPQIECLGIPSSEGQVYCFVCSRFHSEDDVELDTDKQIR